MAPERWTAQRALENRQDQSVCPAVAPIDCNNGQCCAQGSVCMQMRVGLAGCVISNNQGQTLTLTALPKTTSPGVVPPSTTTTSSSTETTSENTSATPPTATTSLPPGPSSTPSTQPGEVPSSSTDSGSFITSVSTLPSSTGSPDTTSPTDPLTLTSSSSSSFGVGVGGLSPEPTATPSNADEKMGANLNRDQTVALVAAPLGAIFLAVVVYLMWRRRRQAKSHTASETSPLQEGPSRDLAEDEQPMAETLHRGPARSASQNSSVSPPSVTTTDILSRADEEGGPLRSHPVTMLGPIPQSPWSRKSRSHRGSGSYRMSGAAPADGSDGDSTYSEPILAPFGQEYIHGRIRYASSPMKFVTTLEESPQIQSSEAVVDHNSSSSGSKESRRQSWGSARWSRRNFKDPSTSSVPNSPKTPGSDWISPLDVGASGTRRWSLTGRQGGNRWQEIYPDNMDKVDDEAEQSV